MKTLRLLLCLGCAAFAFNTSLVRADSCDSVRLLVAKGGAETAKVTICSKTYDVPISFESGLGWADVKDGYTIPARYAALLKHGRITMYIDCGGAEFKAVRR